MCTRIIICLFVICAPIRAATFYMKDYGAIGDDKTDNTAVHVVIRNLDMRTYDNPAIGGINFNWAMQFAGINRNFIEYSRTS
jgi:hypothetical protein